MALLSVASVHLRFGGLAALDGVSFDIEPGGIVGLIGPNGAGKTTLFNVVSGLARAQSGQVLFDGTDITGWPPERITRRGLTRTFQLARGFPRLTVFEHLLVYGQRHPGENLVPALAGSPGARRREDELARRAWEIVRRLGLERVVDSRLDEISGGQKKLAEIGRALMTEPRLILLDEPMAGVNPRLVGEIAEHLRALPALGTTLLLVEHNMDLVARVCDDVVVMAQGRVLARGPFETLREDHVVQQAYLGVAA